MPLYMHLEPLFHGLRVNLAKVIGQQDDKSYFPVPTHITLLAGGTIAQDIHCDFLNWPGEPFQTPVPLSKWFGSGIYLFKDYQTPLEQPAVLIRERPRDEFKDPDGYDRSKIKIHTNETTQQGFITFFGAHIKHGGGFHYVPNCRLHVYFDSTV